MYQSICSLELVKMKCEEYCPIYDVKTDIHYCSYNEAD